MAGDACRYLFGCHVGRLCLSPGLRRTVWRRASGALLGLVGGMNMRKISSRVRIAIGAAAIAAFSVTMLTPSPASAR